MNFIDSCGKKKKGQLVLPLLQLLPWQLSGTEYFVYTPNGVGVWTIVTNVIGLWYGHSRCFTRRKEEKLRAKVNFDLAGGNMNGLWPVFITNFCKKKMKKKFFKKCIPWPLAGIFCLASSLSPWPCWKPLFWHIPINLFFFFNLCSHLVFLSLCHHQWNLHGDHPCIKCQFFS